MTHRMEKPPPRVLILDGESRSALAVTRSLGHAGYEVGVASSEDDALAATSKHCAVFFRIPDSRADAVEFRSEVMRLAREWKPDFLFPMTDLTMQVLERDLPALGALTRIPLPTPESLARVNDKHSLLELAAELGLNVPESLVIPAFQHRTQEDTQKIKRFRFPAVLKQRSTEASLDGTFIRTPVYYPKNADEALSHVSVSTLGQEASIPFLLQSRIVGPGVGVFALMRDGEPLALFCHRRILEKPPSGGPSVLSEAIAESEAPVDDALKLLRALRWTGMAMVEFKRDESGKFYLMEINPRFWGSLQLAIDSERDFPRLLCEVFSSQIGSTPESAAAYRATLAPYRVGTRLRWLLGTIDHALIRFRDEPIRALLDVVLRNALEVLRHPRTTRLEIERREDPRPALTEIRAYLRNLVSSLFHRGAA